jgi:hypothetical protein
MVKRRERSVRLSRRRPRRLRHLRSPSPRTPRRNRIRLIRIPGRSSSPTWCHLRARGAGRPHLRLRLDRVPGPRGTRRVPDGLCLAVGCETERPDGRGDVATRHCDRDTDQRADKDCVGNSPCEDTDRAIHRGSSLARYRRQEFTSRRSGEPRPSFRPRPPSPRPPRRPTSPPAPSRWPGPGRSHPSARSSPGRTGR